MGWNTLCTNSGKGVQKQFFSLNGHFWAPPSNTYLFFFFWKAVFFLPAIMKYFPVFPVSSLMWGGFSLLVVEQNGHKFLVISVNLLALLAGNNWEERTSASAPAQLVCQLAEQRGGAGLLVPSCRRVLVLYKAWQQLGFSSIKTSFQH